MRFENKQYDEERALYGIKSSEVIGCTFDGPADGESALKECRDITVENCDFRLRYPFWHVEGARINDIRMTETCRAALWYCKDANIHNSKLHGIKALRECQNITLDGCDIISAEFGWKCGDLNISNTSLSGEYPFFMCRRMELDGFELKGKYSFQYVEDVVIRNCTLMTKDAFWHAKNVTVYDSVISGEYLAWYSENLRLVRCKITGTQPLCYCKGLILEDCETEGCDLSFENSDVRATVKGNIVSVKNPVSGYVCADSIGEIIVDEEHKALSTCEISVSSIK